MNPQDSRKRTPAFKRTLLIAFVVADLAVTLGLLFYFKRSEPTGTERRVADSEPVEKVQRIRDYLPAGPSLSERALGKWLGAPEAQAPVSYQSAPAPGIAPIVPFQVFGVTYDEDIVIETEHPHWSMHEYARVKVGEREIWLAKDSDARGVQTITAPLDEIETWIPEVPVPRLSSPVSVEDSSGADRLQVVLRYKNPLQESVEVHFEAPRPIPENSGSNGSTFNHSQDFVSPVLDISRKGMFGVKASISFDGKPVAIRKVLGVIPVKALLKQTQGGFAITSVAQRSLPDGQLLDLVRPIDGDTWNTRTKQPERALLKGDAVEWETVAHRFRYSYRNGELQGAEVWQKGQESSTPALAVRLSAGLPDFRRGFAGEVVRHFAVLVNGKIQGHGKMLARGEPAGGATLKILPVAPDWFRVRPLESRITVHPERGEVQLRTQRIQPEEG